MNIVTTSPTMTSVELLDVLNPVRVEYGENEVRRNDFTARCKDELAGDHYETFVVTNPNGTTTEVLRIDQDQCMLILMRESKAVRRKVLEKLKAVASPVQDLPRTFAEALRLAAEQAELIESQQKAIEAAAPKVAFVERYVESTGNLGFREVAKVLQANEARLREWLLTEKIMYRLAGDMVPHQSHIDAGRFVVKTGASDGGHSFKQAKATPKGVEWLAGQWAIHCLRQAA